MYTRTCNHRISICSPPGICDKFDKKNPKKTIKPPHADVILGLFYHFLWFLNITSADNLMTQGTRTSAAKVLTILSRNILVFIWYSDLDLNHDLNGKQKTQLKSMQTSAVFKKWNIIVHKMHIRIYCNCINDKGYMTPITNNTKISRKY